MSTAAAVLKTRGFREWQSATLWVVGIGSTAFASAGAIGMAVNRLQLDMAVYLMGGRNLSDGRLYVVGLPHAPHLPFTYPPFAALVFAPLTALPQSWAQVMWAVINLIALFALVALSLRAAVSVIGRSRLIQWSLVLMGPAYLMEPVRLTFGFGQVNIVLAAALLGDLTVRWHVGKRTLPAAC